MNTIAISGALRPELGTKHAAQLRRAKRVPCVLYGNGAATHFSVDEAALRKVVFTPEVQGVEIDLEGRKVLAMVQEKQFHPLTDRVMHVDFMEVVEGREAKALLAIRLKGQSAGVRKGGKLTQVMRKVRVKGAPAAIPSVLEIDVTDLDLNQSLHVSDLKLPGLTALEREDAVVVSVKVPKKVEEAAPAAAAAATPAAAAPAAAKAGDAKAAPAKPAAKK
jgi:large subunit ribosomal protein L25